MIMAIIVKNFDPENVHTKKILLQQVIKDGINKQYVP